MPYAFPLAHAANACATTVVMIVLALCGRPDLAAEAALVQAAALVTFHAFSGDARSLMLRIDGRVAPETLLTARLLLAIPLAAAAWFLSAGVAIAGSTLAIALIARRVVEWLSELALADDEYHGQRRGTLPFVAAQATLIPAAVYGLLHAGTTLGHVALASWTLGPLVLSVSFLRRTAWRRGFQSLGPTTFRKLSPHIGSTVIIAVSTYAFRTLILALAGKEIAGGLLTAYSLGGLMGSVFAIAAGPSLSFAEGRRNTNAWWSGLLSPRMQAAAIACSALGIALATIAANWAPLLDATGKSPLFWRTVGASLCGGAVMLVAWRARFRLLQASSHDNRADAVFGPDVLANVIVLFAVPLLFSLFGPSGLCICSLLTACASAVIYLGALRAAGRRGETPIAGPLVMALLAALFVPIFIQPSNGLFRDPTMLFDPAGRFALTPLPISIAACFVAIVLLSDHRRARPGLWTLFFATIGLTFATLSTSGDDLNALRVKLTLALQTLLPLPALALGAMLAATPRFSRRTAIVSLAVSGLLAPLQCLASVMQGYWHLHPKVFVFSVYHHLQYVPIVIVSFWTLALFRLFSDRKWRPWVIAAAPGVAAYSVASLSMAAMGVFVLAVVTRCVMMMWTAVPQGGTPLRLGEGRGRNSPQLATDRRNAVRGTPLNARRSHAVWLAAISATAFSIALAACCLNSEMLTGKIAKDGEVAVNLVGRLPCWSFYASAVLSRPETWLAGQALPPPRELFPSAHNLPLDLAYNFGLAGLLPFAALSLVTARRLAAHRRSIVRRPDLLGLAFVVVLLVFVDNLFKVGLRQPYSGIVSCFAWGALLARLERLPRPRSPASDPTGWHAPEARRRAWPELQRTLNLASTASSLEQAP